MDPAKSVMAGRTIAIASREIIFMARRIGRDAPIVN
jgi:hypothetical protein